MGSRYVRHSLIGLVSLNTVEKRGNIWEVRFSLVANVPQDLADRHVLSLFVHIPKETAGRGRDLHIHLAGLDFDNRLSYFDPAALGDQPLIDSDLIFAKVLPAHQDRRRVTHP